MAKFKKGQSGNPGGRPKAAQGLKEALDKEFGENGAELIARLAKWVRSDNLEALKLAMHYRFGTPVQRQEVSLENPVPLEIVLTDATSSPPHTDDRL